MNNDPELESKQKYFFLRDIAFRAAESRILELLSELAPHIACRSISLTEIDAQALSNWERDWKSAYSGGPGGFDWREERRRFTRPSRFDVAIWGGTTLCGLAIGQPSRGKRHLSVHLLEGSPQRGHPLKGVVRYCAIEAAISYAVALGVPQIRLMTPLEPVLPLYGAMGFALARNEEGAQYCWLNV